MVQIDHVYCEEILTREKIEACRRRERVEDAEEEPCSLLESWQAVEKERAVAKDDKTKILHERDVFEAKKIIEEHFPRGEMLEETLRRKFSEFATSEGLVELNDLESLTKSLGDMKKTDETTIDFDENGMISYVSFVRWWLQ